MLQHTSFRLSVRAVIVAAVVLAACGSDSASEGSPVPTELAVPTTADAVAATTSAAPSTSAAPDETVVVVDINDTSACLTGTWELLADQVAGIFDQGMLATIPDLDVSVEGSGVLVLLGDGTYSFSPAYSVVLTIADETGAGAWSGTQQGSWSVDDTTLTLSQISNDITGTVTIMGSTMPLSQPFSFNGATEVVSCDPATFTISTPSPTGPIVQTLVFAG